VEGPSDARAVSARGGRELGRHGAVVARAIAARGRHQRRDRRPGPESPLLGNPVGPRKYGVIE